MYACIVGFPKVLTECAIYYTIYISGFSRFRLKLCPWLNIAFVSYIETHCSAVCSTGVVSIADPAALETSCSVIPCRQRRRRWRRRRRRRQGRRQHHQRRQRQGQQQVQRRRQRHRHQRQQQRRRPQLGHHLSHRLAVHHPRCGVVHMYSEL